MTDDREIAAMTDLLAEVERRKGQSMIDALYPDEDTLQSDGSIIHARHKYQKHLEFFKAGSTYRERGAMCANRVGKSLGMGGYETACHLMGEYPEWWEGRRFHGPVQAWAAGKTNESTRDIIQKILLGEVTPSNVEGPSRRLTGTGLIRGDRLIQPPVWKAGSVNLVDEIKVKHASGRTSSLGLKSYKQGRGSFEGTARHVIWLDEEPSIEIYSECLIRTATVPGDPGGGMIMLTFTPIEGMTEVAMNFMPGAAESKVLHG